MTLLFIKFQRESFLEVEKMQKKKKRMLAVSLILLMSISQSVVASDQNYETVKQKIITISGMSESELEQEILSISQEYGVSKEEVANTLLIDMRNEDTSNDTTYDNGGRSGGIFAVRKLDKSEKGDVWLTEATTIYNHGHVGLDYSADKIIEARGPGHKVSTRGVKEINSKRGNLIMGVSNAKNTKKRMSQKVRNEAVNFANSKTGRAYALTVNNKKCGHNDYNCSQLVWCAYKNSSAKLDLDSDGTWFVTPTDIVNSDRTYVIKRY